MCFHTFVYVTFPTWGGGGGGDLCMIFSKLESSIISLLHFSALPVASCPSGLPMAYVVDLKRYAGEIAIQQWLSGFGGMKYQPILISYNPRTQTSIWIGGMFFTSFSQTPEGNHNVFCRSQNYTHVQNPSILTNSSFGPYKRRREDFFPSIVNGRYFDSLSNEFDDLAQIRAVYDESHGVDHEFWKCVEISAEDRAIFTEKIKMLQAAGMLQFPFNFLSSYLVFDVLVFFLFLELLFSVRCLSFFPIYSFVSLHQTCKNREHSGCFTRHRIFRWQSSSGFTGSVAWSTSLSFNFVKKNIP